MIQQLEQQQINYLEEGDKLFQEIMVILESKNKANSEDNYE